MCVDMAQADRTLRENPKPTDDGVFERHRARIKELFDQLDKESSDAKTTND